MQPYQQETQLQVWTQQPYQPRQSTQEVSGNIPADDINQACCATSVLGRNTQSFHGGQDERTYTTVTQKDIHNISTVLKTTACTQHHRSLTRPTTPRRSITTPTLYADCYQRSPARRGSNTGQSHRIRNMQCNCIQQPGTSNKSDNISCDPGTTKSRSRIQPLWNRTSFGHTGKRHQHNTPLVFLSFQASGTWIYGFTHTAQEQIKHLIAGKTTQQALTLLASLPGVEQASIRLTGFGDDTRLPKAAGYIHLTIFVV